MSSRLIRYAMHKWFLFRRPMTLGVRVLVENAKGEVLLVRHTYVPGWYFPGGGIETGEHAQQSARKELFEETGIKTDGEMILLGVYWNKQTSKRDHVLFYRLLEPVNALNFKSNAEIAEARFFPVDALPEEITKATACRLNEVYGHEPQSAYW